MCLLLITSPSPSSNNKHLNFSLLNFAKENNFTLRDDKDSAMFDIKLRLAHGNNIVPTSASSSGLTLTINNLIIENEDGKVSEDIDKIYLHHCFNKSIYESISLVKNEDSDIKNSYTATFNIPIDKENKGDTKFILYSSDLSKVYSTKDIHAHTDTAVISLGYQDKSSSNFCYSNKVSLRDITDHITNVISDSEYPFKTNEPISLKAIYKQEKGSKRYKEILWGYKVIKSKEYDELSKSNPKDVVALKDQKGKEITFKISDVIQKDDLDKLKQGGHTIVFFAYLEGDKDKFKFYTRYGKNHIRIDIKIPLYIKFKDDKLVIYEFEHAIKEKAFDAKLKLSDNKDDALIKNDNYLYINKDISSNEINIYEDDKLSKELKSDEKTNKSYQIYAKEESSSNQSNADKDDKLGINLLNKEDMDKFINSFNESKSLTRVDKGMWEDGDEGVGVIKIKKEELPWIAVAREEVGVKEITGKDYNPKIIEYHSFTSGNFKDDETPWCPSFVNWVMSQVGIKGTNSAGAYSWKNWGKKLDKPAYGSLAVVINKNGIGHVGFVVAVTKNNNLVILGGNQKDEVRYSIYKNKNFTFVYPENFTPNYSLPTIENGNIDNIKETR